MTPALRGKEKGAAFRAECRVDRVRGSRFVSGETFRFAQEVPSRRAIPVGWCEGPMTVTLVVPLGGEGGNLAPASHGKLGVPNPALADDLALPEADAPPRGSAVVRASDWILV